MNILWLSDKMTGCSAYSKVTAEVCTRLARMGHRVAHVPMGNANRMGRYIAPGGVTVYPSGDSPWCEDVAMDYYVDWNADMLVSLKDPWVFQSIHKEGLNFVPHAIIDHSPVSAAIINRVASAFRVIAVSRFGQRELNRARIDSVYIPHGVRCDIFKPVHDSVEREMIRRRFFFDPDEFVVGVVAMNRARKMIPRMLRGYKLFLDNNPDVKSHLMLWTDVRGQGSLAGPSGLGVADVGVNLIPEIMELGLGESVRWPEQKAVHEGIPDIAPQGSKDAWDMRGLYNSFSVLLNCTGGEGFGLPLIEAQACGVPVITTDYAAGPELVGSGLTVKASDYVIINTPGTRYALADLDRMADALSKVMNADQAKMARKARALAERFDWNLVTEKYWKPFLEDAEVELYPRITRGGVCSWSGSA